RQIVVLNDSELVELDMLPIQVTTALEAQPAETSKAIQHAVQQKNSPPVGAPHSAPASFLDGIEQPEFVSTEHFSEKTSETNSDDIVPLWLTEKQTIENAIALCKGNVPKAAALLDISASTIYRKRQTWDELENSLSH
ncbi:helix-turn-helix domain-containing protein, partial [Shewanella sp. 0m-11]